MISSKHLSSSNSLNPVSPPEAKPAHRGHLKIFLGAAPGVGKTLAMLRAGMAQQKRGTDTVVGLVSDCDRSDIVELLGRLQCLPRYLMNPAENRPELDLDGIIERRPSLVLIDALAYSNPPGVRHPKRWQDVEELLEAGIDVYTTLNVQHIESLNDEIRHISGLHECETIPDTLVERADEIELVDLSADELLERVRQGKVPLGDHIKRTCPHFFQKGSLIALRELALRLTARQVEIKMREYRDDHVIQEVWQVSERVLVCIGPTPMAERLIRAGKRLATELRSEWLVVYVETPELQNLPAERRDGIMRMLRFAEQLGAGTQTLSAPDMAEAILDLASRCNVTKIVMGKPGRRGWRRWLLGSVVDTVIARAHNINIYLLGSPRPWSGESNSPHEAVPSLYNRTAPPGLFSRVRESALLFKLSGYLWASVTTAVCTLIASGLNNRFDQANLIMVYLLGVVFMATRFGRGPAVLVSVLAVILFDFLFVTPLYDLSVAGTQYLFTLGAMLAVALTTSHLTASVRYQARVASHRERRVAALFAISKDMSVGRNEEEIVKTAVRHIHEEFGGRAVILLPNDEGLIVYPTHRPLDFSYCGSEMKVAQWAFDHKEMAGQGTNTLPQANGVYFPLITGDRSIGVLALLPVDLRRIFLPEQQRLLDSFLDQIAQAIERVRMIEQAKETSIQMEAEKLRNSLLNAISHDLRTPLAGIIDSARSLAENAHEGDPAERQTLCREIFEEAGKMSNLVSNILDMAKLDAGAVKLKQQWHSLEQIITQAEARLERGLEGRAITHKLPREFPLVCVDALMIEQVFVNLLENIIRYTPPGSPIEISAERSLLTLSVSVADSGPGIPKGHEERIFDKFHRIEDNKVVGGAGLGLAICRAIVEIHGGWIRAKNKAKGGAVITFLIPQEQIAPENLDTDQRDQALPESPT